jgi:hypothetical protein
MQVSVHIFSEILALDITSSRYLTDIVDTLVSFLSDLNVLLRLWLNLFVNEVYRLEKWV